MESKSESYIKRIKEADKKMYAARWNKTFGTNFDATWIASEANRLYEQIDGELINDSEIDENLRNSLIKKLYDSWMSYYD